MTRKSHSTLRAHRRRRGFTQHELAFLMGCGHGANVAKYERCARCPSLKTAFACELILEAPIRDLFPQVYALVELEVIEKAHQLAAQLYVEHPNAKIEHKLQILEAIITRDRGAS